MENKLNQPTKKVLAELENEFQSSIENHEYPDRDGGLISVLPATEYDIEEELNNLAGYQAERSLTD